MSSSEPQAGDSTHKLGLGLNLARSPIPYTNESVNSIYAIIDELSNRTLTRADVPNVLRGPQGPQGTAPANSNTQLIDNREEFGLFEPDLPTDDRHPERFCK